MWICVPCVWLVKLHNLRCVIFKSEVLFKHEGEQMQWGGYVSPLSNATWQLCWKHCQTSPTIHQNGFNESEARKAEFSSGFFRPSFCSKNRGNKLYSGWSAPPFLAAQWLCGFTWVAVLTLKYWKCDVCQSNPIREYRNTPIWYNRVITIRVTVILYSELMG